MLGGAKAALSLWLSEAESAKAVLSNLPVSLLIGGKGGCILPNRREERFSPTLPNEPHEAKRNGAKWAGARPKNSQIVFLNEKSKHFLQFVLKIINCSYHPYSVPTKHFSVHNLNMNIR